MKLKMNKFHKDESYLPRIDKGQKNLFFEQHFIIEFVITLILLITVLVLFTHFIKMIEARNGVQLFDPILSLFKPSNLSVFIFFIIYLSIIIGLFNLLYDLPRLIFVLQVYTLLMMIRILTLYLIPLNPPSDMIPLIDPIVQNIGTGQLLTKDLFFSGHTALMFLLFLSARNKKLKVSFFICFIIIAIALLIQHVHYTIDVVSAPFFTYTSYRFVVLSKNKYLFKKTTNL